MKVSVILLTYNHAPYIAQAIDSVLSQEVDFDYELLISEDCSTDGTREILHDYQRRCPERIRLLLSPRNLGSGAALLRAALAARGQYVAVLEGDDYWTSPQKLRRQVEFLDHHPDYAICHHNVEVFHEDGSRPPYLFNPPEQPATSSLEDLLVRNFMQTCSVMVRNRPLEEVPAWFGAVAPKDWAMHILNAQHGRIGYLPEVMAAYRIHAGSLWSSRSRAERLSATAVLYTKVNEHFGFRYRHILDPLISRCRFELSVELSGLADAATVIVLGDARDALAVAEGRRVWSFPQNPDGTYSAEYPPTAAQTIAQLESLHAGGGEFLLVPASAFVRLAELPEFHGYLEARHRRLWSDEHCIIYALCDAPAVLVHQVWQAPLDAARLQGFHLDLPRPGGAMEAARIPCAGWVLGRGSPAVAVEVVSGSEVLQRIPVGAHRPDVAAAFPEEPRAYLAGFGGSIQIGPSATASLRVQVLLADESRVPLAAIRLAAAGGADVDSDFKLSPPPASSLANSTLPPALQQ